MEQLTASLENLRSSTRVLVLAAKGKHFCAGADINWMKQSVHLTAAQNHEDAMVLSDMLQALNTFPHPTIAKVQGAAMGGGTGLVCCCDIVVATENSRFAFSEVKLGIMPATISPYAIQAIGHRAARRYFQSAEIIRAPEAFRLGLVHDVCAQEDLDKNVQEKISALMQCGPHAQTYTKQLIARVAGEAITDELRNDLAAALAKIRTSDEAQEGLGAFLDKRKAQW